MKDQDNVERRLSDEYGEGWVVVYFYPRDGTPGCTAQACKFRDEFETFKDEGVKVIGISSDKTSTHRSFADKFSLPFILLSDQKGEARKAFNVPKNMGILPGRVTFVIDKEGMVRMVFNSQMRATEHVERAIEFIKDSN